MRMHVADPVVLIKIDPWRSMIPEGIHGAS